MIAHKNGRMVLAAIFTIATVTAVAAAAITTVSQKARAFATAAVQIAHGDTIRFSNDDEFIHQIYVESPGFTYESDEQPPGTKVDVVFTKSGTFEVRCHIHPKMLLHVDVH
jgi:plastocyanin